MYSLSVENTYGDILELTNNPAYCITNVDGIDPPDATINTARNAGADGSVFNSAYMNNRTITITMAINGPAEANRIELYRSVCTTQTALDQYILMATFRVCRSRFLTKSKRPRSSLNVLSHFLTAQL